MTSAPGGSDSKFAMTIWEVSGFQSVAVSPMSLSPISTGFAPWVARPGRVTAPAIIRTSLFTASTTAASMSPAMTGAFADAVRQPFSMENNSKKSFWPLPVVRTVMSSLELGETSAPSLHAVLVS